MSGIVALVDRAALRGSAPPQEPVPDLRSHRYRHRELLAGLTQVTATRGPDGTGIWWDGVVGLSHALLRTGTRGEQAVPGVVHDEESGLHIVADARLDDRSTLARALRDAGVSVGGLGPSPDTPVPELLLAAWKVWGEACPEHLLGAFAFVLWDARRQLLFAARDAFGVKPLFIAEIGADGGQLLLSNTLPVMLAHPDVPWEPDERSVADHLLWGMIEDERRTYFDGIQQVERGTSLTIHRAGVRRRRWWRLPEPELRIDSHRSVLDEFGTLLGQAVADRLPDPTHPALLELSGGLDSGTIAAAARAQRDDASLLPALTVGYARLFEDPEPAFARMSSAALELPHEVVYADDWVQPLPGLARLRPEWAADPQPWPQSPGWDTFDAETALAAARARVALTGWDGDALLYGDPLAALQGRGGGAPGPVDAIRSASGLARYAGALRRLPRIGARGALRARLHGSSTDVMDGYPSGWFDPDFEERQGLRERWARAVPASDRHDSRWRTRQALDGAVWTSLFFGLDGGSTGQPLEFRHPLMDLRLVTFFLSLGSIPWCVEKGLFRLWLRGRLPDPVRRRPKQGLQGDPDALVLLSLCSSAEGRRRLRDLVSPVSQDLAKNTRFLRHDWDEIFLRGAAGASDSLPPYWGVRAHAVGRWLRRLEGPR